MRRDTMNFTRDYKQKVLGLNCRHRRSRKADGNRQAQRRCGMQGAVLVGEPAGEVGEVPEFVEVLAEFEETVFMEVRAAALVVDGDGFADELRQPGCWRQWRRCHS